MFHCPASCMLGADNQTGNLGISWQPDTVQEKVIEL